MQLTDYHAKYFAHELTKRCAPDSVEKRAGAVASAQVDLNPHQIDAALFAFKSPLSKGALLADEVGLGNPGQTATFDSMESRRIALGVNSEVLRFRATSVLFAAPSFLTEEISTKPAT